jgi:hypothetical protein
MAMPRCGAGEPVMTAMEDQCRWFLLIHVPDAFGCCVWCTKHYPYRVPHPCPRRKLADSILSQEAAS